MERTEYEQILQSLPVGACLVDDEGRVVFLNGRAERALGVAADQVDRGGVSMRIESAAVRPEPMTPEATGIVTGNPEMLALLGMLPGVAQSESPVLILGETGTGKEVLARAIHALSTRRDGPFVAVNCGALPDNLLESELFGYKKGAFTDAVADKPGRFAAAAGGTLFLDEIGDISTPMQVKLLRVLQEKRYEPLGATDSVAADVRILAATHRDLDQMMAAGQFRSDLYYRIHVVELRIPPLRERPEDIPLLVRHFIDQSNTRSSKTVRGVSQEAMRRLIQHPFPGNVRELENLIERAHVLCPHSEIQADCLPPAVAAAGAPGIPHPAADSECCGHVNFDRRNSPITDDQEREFILKGLQRFGHHRKRTAQAMGIDPSTLWRKMKKHGIL